MLTKEITPQCINKHVTASKWGNLIVNNNDSKTQRAGVKNEADIFFLVVLLMFVIAYASYSNITFCFI